MAGLTLDVGANTRSAVSGVKDIGEALEKVSDALDDVARDAERPERAIEDIGDAGRDAARDIDAAGDKVERTFRDMVNDAKAADRAVADVGDSGSRSLGKVGERSAEVGQEIRQNLGEGIANAARGDFEGLADTIGDTLGGAVAGIGGIGFAAAGAAGALGLGAIVAVVQGIAAETERTKQIAAENFRQMATDGVDAWASVQSQMQRLTDAYADHEGEIQRIADLTGLTFEDVAGAWAGIPDKVATVDAAYGDMVKQLENTFGVTREGVAATVDGWSRIMGPLNGVLEGYDAATAKAKTLDDQQQAMWSRAINSAESATEEVDEFGNRLLTLPAGEQVLIEADTGRATTDLSKFGTDLDGIAAKIINPTVQLRVDTSAWDNLRLKQKTANVVVNAQQGRIAWD